MRIKNRSRYSNEEIRTLLEYSTRGINMSGVGVLVIDADHARSGFATRNVPWSRTPFTKMRSVKYFIKLRIGPPEKYPHSTARTKFVRNRRNGTFSMLTTGYGGKSSPIMELQDWQEGFVTLAAHEARHIHQFRHQTRKGEVDAEKWSEKILERFRLERDQVI